MDSFQYVKERRQFGRECLFAELNKVIESIMPDTTVAQDFIRRDPVHQATHLEAQYAASQANTINAEFRAHGASHNEGGWPKEINMLDEEQTLRYRKKIERDDQYPIQLSRLLKPMLAAVNQNNGMKLYENYFEEQEPLPPMEAPSAKIVQCFRNPSAYDQPQTAAATHMCFSPDGGSDMAVAYANTGYHAAQLADLSSYIWRLDCTQRPLLKLHCSSACLSVEYNPRDRHMMTGGLMDGKVCVWDSRLGGDPTHLTRTESSHRTRVTSVQWLQSKTNTVFYSGSSDGRLLTWDMRKMQAPIESLVCDPVRGDRQSLASAYGISVLEYEYTMPNKFMVGTEEGAVFFGNRKGTSPGEVMYARMQCNHGPIRALERNPMFYKFFVTVAENRVNIFSEECRENPLMFMCHRPCELTCGAWSRTRGSLMCVGRADGVLDVWDILVSRQVPVVSLKVSEGARLERCRAHETGKFVACGDVNGETFLVELAPPLRTTDKAEKVLLSAMLERETKREKIMEAKVRELKLRVKLQRDEATRASKLGKAKKSDKNVVEPAVEPAETAETAETAEAAAIKSDSPSEVDPREQVKREFMEVVLAERQRRDASNKY